MSDPKCGRINEAIIVWVAYFMPRARLNHLLIGKFLFYVNKFLNRSIDFFNLNKVYRQEIVYFILMYNININEFSNTLFIITI